MKLFEYMSDREKLELIKEYHKELRPLLENYLTMPLADIWDWEESWIPYLIARLEELEAKRD